MLNPSLAKRNADRLLWPFLALLALNCLWVLSLPVFPTQDGPMHYYYYHLLAELLSGHGPLTAFFRVRTYLPAYAVHYYLLIALTRILSVALSEKLAVCIIFCVQAFGFRQLARESGPSGSLVSLWFMPLLVTWPVLMGFFNFSLSLGFAFWVLYFWVRALRLGSSRLLLAYLLLLVLMSFTHPVPLYFALVVSALFLAWNRLDVRRHGPGHAPQGNAKAAMALATGLGLGYYVHRSVNGSDLLMTNVTNGARIHSIVQILKLNSLEFCAGNLVSTDIYRLFLYGMLGLALLAAVRQVRRRASLPGAAFFTRFWLTVAGLLGLLVVATILVINPDYEFAERLVLIVWACALLAASGADLPGPEQRRYFAVAACVAVVLSVAFANYRIRPIAEDFAYVRATPLGEPPGSVGLMLANNDGPRGDDLVRWVSFNPYLWSGAYVFGAADTVMLNAPWMRQPHIPIASRSGIFNGVLPPAYTYLTYADYLEALPAEKRRPILAKANFIDLSSVEQGKAVGWFDVYPNSTCRPVAYAWVCDHP